MTPDMHHTAADTGDEPATYREAVIFAYLNAMNIHPEDIQPLDARRIHQALIAHADTDHQAAEQAEISVEQIHHDRTSINATDGLPLMIVAVSRETTGRFYFSRPIDGWPRPGHRHPH